MNIKNLLLNIIFICGVFLAVLISNTHIHSRLMAHIDAYRGIVKKAETVRVTFPEGSTNLEMADILEKKLPNFNKETFLILTESKQGYLFPDTYLFYPKQSVESIVSTLEETYKKKVGNVNKDYVIMASLLEEEGKNNDMGIISGILWKRLSRGMPLQADAAPITYKEKGLPSTPISNPGLNAIKASLYPEDSEYFYYLHGKDGNIHLAKSYEDHKKNIRLYLK